MQKQHLSITAVERDIGLSKDVLRVWERRYGFPAPERDANGDRAYPAEQVQRLRLIKRLMDHGHRPGRLLSMSADELIRLSVPDPTASSSIADEPNRLGPLVDLILKHDAEAYVQALQQQLARQGLATFVHDTVAPLILRIGWAWEEGRLHVFEEHLFSELTERVLRQAIATIPRGNEPRVLLTTLAQEQHAMGLLMVEALLSLEGALCIPLGTQMPLTEVACASLAHRADVVALSFSMAFPARQLSSLLLQLRGMLPAATELWAGGSGVIRIAAPEGVKLARTLEDAVTAVLQWRRHA
jgi:methanogenic corrinoid protein MtbC1